MSRSPWYRLLLKVYPREFRERYGREMEEVFVRLLEMERRRRGVWGWLVAGTKAAWDVVGRGLAMRFAGPGGAGRGHSSIGRRTGGGGVMGSIATDLRQAIRGLAQRPLFTLSAVVTLALGIGATTAIFTLVNGLLLRPFPYEDPDELVKLYAAHAERGWSGTDVSMADVWYFRQEARSLEDVAVYDKQSLNLTGGDSPERVEAVAATPNILGLLGVEPALGRDFTWDDNRPGAPGAAILADGFWARRFGRDPSVLGGTLTLDGQAVTVVGIMPAGFVFLDEMPDLWVPFRTDPATTGRGSHSDEAIGRLADGFSVAQAQQELSALADRLARDFPAENEGWGAEVLTLRDDALGDIAKQASLVLLGAVGFLLLMACVNVANLLLARAGSRRLEMSIRTALGAGRARLVRQLLTESAVLALVGGGLGALMAVWGSRLIVAGLPENTPPVFTFEVDAAVLLFATAAAGASAVVFGLVPALRASDTTGLELKDGGRSASGGRFGGTLVVVQTALAVVLLVGSGILFRSVEGMRTQDFGWEPEGVLTMVVRPPEAKYPDADALGRFYDEVLERVRALPGVVSTGTIQSPPLGGSNYGGTFRVEGVGSDVDNPARFAWISTGYLEAMDIDLVAGRAFNDADRADAPMVAMVNELLVERYLPDGMDPVGARLQTWSGTQYRVIGVVEDHIARGVEDPVEPSVYLHVAQNSTRTRALMTRTAVEPEQMIEPLRAAVWAVDPDQPVFAVRTMTDLIEVRLSGFQLLAELMGVFALISLTLGAVGIYGVTAYAVGRRSQEIGVRMAMGARASDVVRMVVKESMVRAGVGLAVGMVLAFGLAGALSGIVVGVDPRAPSTFLVVGAVLVVVTLLGSYLPGRRATRVDPVQALTAE